MLLLASTSDKLQVVTSAALATDVHASWVDVAAGVTAPGRANTAISTAATTDVVASPGSGVIRNVKALSVRNKDASTPQTVTVRHTDGTTTVELYQATLLAGQSLQYTEETGFIPPPSPTIAVNCGLLYYVNTTTLGFQPFRGGLITINGIVYSILLGVTGLRNTGIYIDGVAGQNLAANTLYYVYVFNNAGTLTADFSTTGHTYSAAPWNAGTEIKQASDDTRSLIGMVRTGAGGIFVSSLAQTFVRSWFNETTVFGYKFQAADYTTASGSFAEFSSNFRVEWINFSAEVVQLSFTGQYYSTPTPGNANWISLGMDSAAALEGAYNVFGSYADGYGQMASARAVLSPAEGYHYGTVLGKVSAPATDTLFLTRAAASAGNRSTNQVVISRGR